MIRTYYWYDRVSGWKFPAYKVLGLDVSRRFKVGNAGDIYTKNVISYVYNEESINIKNKGSRLLTVGSILHLSKPGDVICGAGVKSENLLDINVLNECYFHALRGPKSYDILKKNNVNLSNVSFLYDPGLMIRYMFDFEAIKPTEGKRIFIPHYRERKKYYNFKDIEVVDIDDDPINVARKICSAEVIYTSSLHGVIFSHSLNRICILIQPQTIEPAFKYEDYYSSIGVDMPQMANSIYDALTLPVPISPLELKIKEEEFIFPDKATLSKYNIMA